MIILGTNSIKDTGYDVDNSLRFNDGSSDDLQKTYSSAETSNKIATVSFWIKRCLLATEMGILKGDNSGSDFIRFEPNDQLRIRFSGGSADIQTNRVFRDVSAWYHIVVAFDSTQGTSSNRIKVYVNGVQETSLATSSYPSQNTTFKFSTNSATNTVGADGSQYYDGYISEFVWIDGQQLAPDQFGEFDEDNGIWKPIDVSGLTFGTNGFYLDFEDSSALGNDVSGNNNDFTVNNLTAIDQSTDTCTNNFATLNPLINTNQTLSDGNTVLDFPQGNDAHMYSNIGFSAGKFYAEFKINSFTADRAHSLALYTDITTTGLYLNFCKTGNANVITSFGSAVQTNLASFSAGDIIGMAVDADNGTVDFTKNGSAYGSQVTGLSSNFSGKYLFFGFFGEGHGSLTRVFNASCNFGSPAFAISSGNTDGNGYGNFEYAVPSGYLSLCTKNLSEVLG